MKPNVHFTPAFQACLSLRDPGRSRPSMPGPRLATWVALGVALLICNVATAQTTAAPLPNTVATATSVEGTAYVTRADGRQSILARGSALGVGDALSTSRNTTVRRR